jgi:hypothetical protein
MSHQQIYMDIIESGEKCRIIVAGTANKNKLGYERKVKKIAQSLSNETSDT